MAKLTQRRKFAEAHFLPGRIRRWAGKFVFWVFALLYFTADVVLLSKLAPMRLEGLAPAGLAVLAVSFAFTSLLFNRARAHPNGQLQRRSLLAAEHAIRANLWFVIAFALGAAIFFALTDLGYNVTNSCELLSNQPRGCSPLPGFLAFVVFVPLLAGLTAFSTALKMLVGKAVGFLLTRPFLERSAREHRNVDIPSPSILPTNQQIERFGDLHVQRPSLDNAQSQRLRMRIGRPSSQQRK